MLVSGGLVGTREAFRIKIPACEMSKGCPVNSPPWGLPFLGLGFGYALCNDAGTA